MTKPIRHLSMCLLVLVSLTLSARGQDRFNPTEAAFPTPLRAIVTAGVEGWQGDLDGLVDALLNSPGDGVRAKIKIEGSGGAGGGGGALIELEGMFSRAEDGRYELSVGGDLSAFAGAELIQDVEAKAAATLGGKVVFAFDTASDAVRALRDLAVVQLATNLDVVLAQALQRVEDLEAAAQTLRAIRAEFGDRVRILAANVEVALQALDRVPGFRAFAAVRAAAKRVLTRFLQLAERARETLDGIRDELRIKDRLLAKARSFHAFLAEVLRDRMGMVSFLRNHFAAVEVALKVSGEAEARVDLADALLPGISLQGDQWGVGGKVEASVALRIVRGIGGARHQVEVAMGMGIEVDAEGAVVAGLEVKAKVAAELKRIYEVPTLNDVVALVDDMLATLDQAPATWPGTLADRAQAYAWRQLGLISARLTTDVQAQASVALVAGGAFGLGRTTTMEVQGDDAVATLWTALCELSVSAAADARALHQDPTLDRVLITIQHAFLAPYHVAQALGWTPATFTVQDRLQGGLIFMLGYSAAECGGAVEGSVLWTDQGPLRSEKLPAAQGLNQTIAGTVRSAILGIGS